MKTQRLYCFVDEAGQDDRSKIFVVVAVLEDGEHEGLRERMIDEERRAGVGKTKWHNAHKSRRIGFLRATLHKKLVHGNVFTAQYLKPTVYFDAIADAVGRALDTARFGSFRAVVSVDGIDKKKAEEITRLLRARGIRLERVRSVTDESEVFIRYADRWAGCVRASLLGDMQAGLLFDEAKRCGHVRGLE